MRINKYHKILNKILVKGKVQENKKGRITYLINEKNRIKANRSARTV
jgi:thymidylate synthase